MKDHDRLLAQTPCTIVGIIPKVKFVPEAQLMDTNDQGVLSLLMTVGRKHILMARSIAEGPQLY